MRTKELNVNGTVRESSGPVSGTLLQENGAAVMMRGHRRGRCGACGFYGAFKRICRV